MLLIARSWPIPFKQKEPSQLCLQLTRFSLTIQFAPTLGVDFFLLADAQHKPANQHDCRKKDQPIDQ